MEPALNLALDEALLRSGEETLRLYAWDPPGFSLGFFQRAAASPGPPGFALVRRPTGGGAIAHHAGELTVAWIGRRERVDDVYRRLNAAVATALRALGVESGPGEADPEAAPRGLCFDAHTRYDLLAHGRKIFGSAQRRGAGHFLVHGSLILAPNPWTPGAISVEEVTGHRVDRLAAEEAIISGAGSTWGAGFSPAEPTEAEWEDARSLVGTRYANPAWTHRR